MVLVFEDIDCVAGARTDGEVDRLLDLHFGPARSAPSTRASATASKAAFKSCRTCER